MKPVIMYTTAVCPYCIHAKKILAEKGVAEIKEIRIDLNQLEREKMIKLTARRTVPQIFIGGIYVGGCDDLAALNSTGELDRLLVDSA
jgi:glutaredoxin 3